MASSKAGISALMEAEQKAADIIQAARLLKKQRKAQADQDALAEINLYKAQRQREFEGIKTAQAGGERRLGGPDGARGRPGLPRAQAGVRPEQGQGRGHALRLRL